VNELLAELLKMARSEDREKAEGIVTKIKGKVSDIDAEVTAKESAALKATADLNAANEALAKVSSELGVKDGFADAITKLKNSKSGDSKIKDKEIDALKTEIALAKEEYTAKMDKSKVEMMSVLLEKDVAVLLPKHKAKVNAANYIVDSIKKSAVFADGKIVFKNEDGTTRRTDGRDSTLDDIIGSMAEAEKKAGEAMFFNIEPQKSGAGGNVGGIPSGGDFVV
jgi:hypothetical protein